MQTSVLMEINVFRLGETQGCFFHVLTLYGGFAL